MDPKVRTIYPRPRLGRRFDSWRDWWFGYVCQPNPQKPAETRYWLLDCLWPPYAPFSSASVAVANLEQLFVRASELIPRYGREAVSRGLWNVAQPLRVQHATALWDHSVEDTPAKRAIEAMAVLFTDLFAPHCEPAMSSGGSETNDKLNGTCYMWFDLIGLDSVNRHGIDKARVGLAAQTLEHVLAIPHIACQESALHGLGHIAEYRADLVRDVIDDFLAANPAARPKLRAYAAAARKGYVQ